MSDTTESLRQRVQILQRELEFKRKLLKSAEKKTKSSISSPTDSVKKENANASVRSSFTSTGIIPSFTLHGNSFKLETQSCVMASFTSLSKKTIALAHLLCFLLNSDELLLAIAIPKSTDVRVVWRKRVRAGTVAFLRIISHPDPYSVTPNVGVILAEQFQSTDCVVTSLYLFHCPLNSFMTNTHLVDVISIPLPRNPNSPLTDLMPFSSILFGSYQSRVSLLLFSPVSLNFALFHLFDSQKDATLNIRLVHSWYVDNPIHKWGSILSSYNVGGSLDYTMLSVHSAVHTFDLIGYIWPPDLSLPSQNSFRFIFPHNFSEQCSNLRLQQFVSVALDGHPHRALLSLLLEINHCSDHSTRTLLVVATLTDVQCFVVRCIDMCNSCELGADTRWFILSTRDDPLAQLVIAASVRNRDPSSELRLSAWSAGTLLETTEEYLRPASAFSSAIPIDFSFCLFPFDLQPPIFSKGFPLLFLVWYNRATCVFEIFTDF